MTVNTAPWSAAVLDVVTRPFQSVLTVTAYVAGFGTPLRVTAADLSIDGRRAPRYILTVKAAWPPDGVLAQLTPWSNASLIVDAGYVLPGGSVDSQRIGRFRLTEAVRDSVEQTIELTAESEESIPIGYPLDTESTVATAEATTKVAAAKALIEGAFPGQTITWTVPADVDKDQTFATTQATRYGDDRWEAVTDWLESIDAKAYSTGWLAWTIEQPRLIADAAVRARLKTGPGGTITQLRIAETKARGYATRVMVQWVSRSGSTTTTTTVIAKTNLTPVQLRKVTRNRPVENGPKVARQILRRALRRTHQVTLSAAALYWLRPGHAATIDRPDGGQDRVLIDSVRFDLVAGTMDLVGRTPPTHPDAAIDVSVSSSTTT